MSLHGRRESLPGMEGRPQESHRVTMACDECRRRKIKCNGQKPCPHCLGYELECVYNVSRVRKKQRSGVASRFEELSLRVNHLERRLRASNEHANKRNLAVKHWPTSETLRLSESGKAYEQQAATFPSQPAPSEEIQVDTLIASKERFCSDNEGNLSYTGNASYYAILQKLEDIAGRSLDLQVGGLKPIPTPEPKLFELHSSSSTSSPDIIFPISKERTIELVASALDKACALLCFIHRPEFERLLGNLFQVQSPDDSAELRKFFPLFYAVLALGCLFSHSTLEASGFEGAIQEGAEYYRRSRGMIDIVTCKDVTSLQTVVILNMFLECTGKLTHCYSYLAVTVTLALRMGLHRSVSSETDDVQSMTRRKLFWAIRNMETRLSVLLGLPRLLGETDSDQDVSFEASQGNQFANGHDDVPDRQFSPETDSTAYRVLTQIMERVIRDIYAVKAPNGGASGIYTVSYTNVQKIESELESWKFRYPYWLDDNNTSPSTLRSRYTLRLFHMHIQLMLYRPFLHHISRSQSTSSDWRAQKYAHNCVEVSRAIIYLGRKMIDDGFLTGAYWFEFYTVLSAVLTIMFPILARDHDGDIHDLLRVARTGHDILRRGGHGSRTANSSYHGLCRLFDRLGLILNKIPKSTTGGEQYIRRSEKTNLSAAPAGLKSNLPFAVPEAVAAGLNCQPNINDDSSKVWRYSMQKDAHQSTSTLPETVDYSRNLLPADQSIFLSPNTFHLPKLRQKPQSLNGQDHVLSYRAPNAASVDQEAAIAERQQETIQLLPYSFSADMVGLGAFQDINILDMLNMEAWDNSMTEMQDDLLP